VSIALELPDLESLRREQARLRAQLRRLRNRLALQTALEFAVDAAIAVTAVAVVLVALDWSLRLGTTARMVLLTIAGLGLFGWLAVRAARRWRDARLDELSLAVTLDRFRPGVGQQVADVLQLPGLLDEPAYAASPAMVRLAVRRATEALDASDWHRLWNRKRTAVRGSALLGCLLVPVLFALIAPDAAGLSFRRWLLASSERWPQDTYLTVVGLGDGDRLVAPRGEPFVVEVRSDLPQVEKASDGWHVLGRGEPLVLRREPKAPKDPGSVSVREQVERLGRRDGVFTVTGPSRFRFEFPPADASSTFELTGGDDWLGPIRIERLDRPELAEVKLRVREPGARYEGFRDVEDTHQNLIFLPDTQVELTLVGNEPLSDLTLDVHPGEIGTPERVDARTFRSAWTLTEAVTLEIRLTSEPTGLASKPAFLSIGLMRDREPRVSLRAMGVGARVTPVATIPLSIGATDDIGLASLDLHVDRVTPPKEPDRPDAEPRAPETRRETVAIPLGASEDRAVLDHQARHDVDLATNPPPIGTILKILAEATDQCARGPQAGRSAVLQLQVVSPDELFYDILIRQRAERAKFLAALQAVEAQQPTLDGSPSKDEYVNAMRVLHTTSRQLEQIASRIADTLQEMKLNQVGSPKSHRLLQEGVVDPIRALDAGTMGELRGVLQSLGGGAAKSGADANEARRLHGEVVTSMRNILEQMSQWESFVDVVNQVTEVIKMESKVLEATEKARESRTQEVFDEEK
jgi:hypothetical protein